MDALESKSIVMINIEGNSKEKPDTDIPIKESDTSNTQHIDETANKESSAESNNQPKEACLSDTQKEENAKVIETGPNIETKEDFSSNTNNLYIELIKLDNLNIIENQLGFDCEICLLPCEPMEGVTLMDCLHSFCKDCLATYIKTNKNTEIKCPYNSVQYMCESIMQHCEIKELVDESTYKKYTDRSLAQAEYVTENSHHCQNINCTAWYICDETQENFTCEVCNAVNCLQCKAIHKHLTCFEYQATIHDPDKHSRNYLQEVINKSGMNCPSCGVVIEKTGGCDGITCTYCKTDICWITKKRRWGPRGKGDSSGGCRCNVGGIRCHPYCKNCH